MPNDQLDENNSPVKKAFDSKKFAAGVATHYKSNNKKDISTARGVADVGMDFDDIEGMTQFDSPELYRAVNQGQGVQAFNGIIGGIASGLATAVEDISYLVDFENHYKAAVGLDTWEKNWLAESMGNVKKSIDEAMPIYRQDSQTINWDDSGFYWSALKGVIDSAVGFGLPGGAIAKGVGLGIKGAKLGAMGIKASKAGRAAAKLNKIKAVKQLTDSRVAAYMQTLGNSEKATRLTQAGIAGTIQNFAEGKMMGLEVYDSTLESFTPMIESGQITEERAKELAAMAADEMLFNNRAMILTDAFSIYGLAKGLGVGQEVLKPKGMVDRFKNFGESMISMNANNMFLQGGKEAAEEIAQNMIQMEAEYGAQEEGGQDVSDRPDTILDRLFGFATSDQALLEGMMGFFGGGPQRILSEAMAGDFSKTARDAYNERMDEQQVIMAKNSDYVEEVIKGDTEQFKMRDAHLKAGDIAKAKAVEDNIVAKHYIDNMELGTGEEYKKKMQEIADGKMSDEKKAELGPDAQKKAAEFLETMKILDKEWGRHAGKPNVSEIVRNKSKREINKAVIKDTQSKIAEATLELEGHIDEFTANRKPLSKGEGLEKTPFVYDINQVLKNNKNPYNAKTDPKAHSQYKRAYERIANSNEFKKVKQLQHSLSNLNEKLDKLNLESEYLRTPPAGADFMKRQAILKKQRQDEAEMKKKSGKTPVGSPIKGKMYDDGKGAAWEFGGVTEDGKYLIKEAKSKSKKFKELSEEEFNAKFLGEDNTYAQFEDVEIINTEKKEEANKNENTASKEKETPTSDEEIINNTPTGFDPDRNNPESTNTEHEKKSDNSKVTSNNKSKIITAASWFSYNHSDYDKAIDAYNKDDERQKKDKDITEYLEEKNSNIVGKKVEISIDADLTEESYIGDMPGMIMNGAIKITVLDDNDVPVTHNGTQIDIYLHEPNYLNKSNNKTPEEAEEAMGYAKSMAAFREKVLIKINDSTDGKVYSTIESKSMGHIQSGGQDDYANLDSIEKLGRSSKNIKLAMLLEDGHFSEGIERNSEGLEERTFSDNLQNYSKDTDEEGATWGTVYYEEASANGEIFPVRVQVSNIDAEEADIVYDIMSYLIANENAFSTSVKNSGLQDKIENSSDKVKQLLDIMGEDTKLTDFLNNITYNGIFTKEGNYPLYIKNGAVYYGKGNKGKPNFFRKENAAKNKKRFIKYLMDNKIRNVNFRLLNEPTYKEYIISNGIIQTNIETDYNEDTKSSVNGTIFAQPTIVIANNFKTEEEQNTPEVEIKNDVGELAGVDISEGNLSFLQSQMDAKKKEAEPQQSGETNINQLIEEIVDNKSFVYGIDEDGNRVTDGHHDYYYNERTKKRYDRVSDFIGDGSSPDESNPKVVSSLIIGTKTDGLVRDFFDGVLKESLSDYDLADDKVIKKFLSELTKLKKHFDDTNQTVMANDIVLYDDVTGVAGTVDLLTYDADGVFRIYDMKTMSRNQFVDKYTGDNKVIYETERYGMSNKEKHSKQLSLYRIMLNNTHGIKAKELFIIPIVVKYNGGDEKTTKLDLRSNKKSKKLSKINMVREEDGSDVIVKSIKLEDNKVIITEPVISDEDLEANDKHNEEKEAELRVKEVEKFIDDLRNDDEYSEYEIFALDFQQMLDETITEDEYEERTYEENLEIAKDLYKELLKSCGQSPF